MALSGKYGQLDIPRIGKDEPVFICAPRINWQSRLSRCTDCWQLRTAPRLWMRYRKKLAASDNGRASRSSLIKCYLTHRIIGR